MFASLLLATMTTPQVSPVVMSGPAEQQLFAWMPGPVRCAGFAVTGTPIRRPLTGLRWPGGDQALRPATYTFRIDANGRPLSIARAGEGYVWQGEDIAPSLAASRFPAGAARSDCTIAYTARLTPMAAAPVADLMSYTISPTMGVLPRTGWDRLPPAGATCRNDPQPQALVRVYPDFRMLPGTPGLRNWSMLQYDIDVRGRPANVRVVEGTGNAPLNAASIKALKAWRYTPGARTGCLFPFRQAPKNMAAPVMPDQATLAPANGNCPVKHDWVTRPLLTYPDPWRRRAIEGWAVVAFDVAPWGATGNLRVLASEPSTEFGEQAVRMLGGAKLAASPTGQSGCVDRILFVLRPADTAPAAEMAP
ncbi:hypothetical protein ASG67_14565 [Sphingomonas sp. Leaf339]|uniref:TonB family protein n=1 Tax=Sphingomonas sp. Leaf339 TaxID=1736343 RepID=UPI0006F67C97|nr:TonB family protein [Sphingomonas sp. Leaf339]KQU47467.1 hypothetical protein ASG67_14565 [Sphingomonas sp. Leaf339]